MENILSQDEVDALLRGVTGGEVEESVQEPEEPQEGPVPYDLGNQEWIVRGRMPTLDVIHQQFSRLFRLSLAEVLRKTIEVTVTNQSVLKFSEFTRRLPVPAYLQVISMEPLRGYAMAATDAATVYLLVDHFFGGAGQTHVKPEGQDFTLIEQRIMRKVMLMGLANLEKAWDPVHKVNIKAVRSEMNPQLASIVLPSDIVIVITIGIELGDAVGDLHLCIPYAMLEPLRERLQVSFQSDFYEVDQGWVNRFSERIRETSVTMSVHLGSTRISVEDLMNFSAGDVIVLEQPTDEPLVGTIEGVPKFYGFPGTTKASQSFQIRSMIMPKE
ncbi:MAG: flagellar motor switch protein FliM [Nitrospirales bacterium]|nr:MAG: flagellar motor switch protein FliM [Nitrospirales bacterium]